MNGEVLSRFTILLYALAVILPTMIFLSVTYSTFDADAQLIDVDEPPTNATEELDVKIDAAEPLPLNGTVTVDIPGAEDIDIDAIPPEGVSVIITNTTVTVTNSPAEIEEGAGSDTASIATGTNETTNTTFRGNGIASSMPPAAGPRFNAGDISQTNSLNLDSDVKNLVILIPDKRLVTQNFLPLDATIVEGTKVIWSNADEGAIHGISLQDNDMEVLLTNATMPYKNGTEYTFDTQGTFTFYDPTNTDPTTNVSGTINVIAPANAPDNLSTNSTQATAGLFVVQAEDKAYFDQHFNILGYHVEDSHMIPGPDGNDIQVYAYTQKSGKYSTIVDLTAMKSDFVDAQIEEEDSEDNGDDSEDNDNGNDDDDDDDDNNN